MSISCQQCRDRLGESLDAFPDFVSSADAAAALAAAPLAVAASPQTTTASSPSEADFSELARHIENCVQCRTDLTILSVARETMRALPMQVAPPDLRARVRAQIKSEAARVQVVSAQNDHRQPALAGEQAARLDRGVQSTLGGWIEAWSHFFRRPASVAWASGLALAAFAVFAVQRNPSATFPTHEQPINDISSGTPTLKAPPVAGRITQKQAPNQGAGLKNAAPGIASRAGSASVQAPANPGASQRNATNNSTPAFKPPAAKPSRRDTPALSATSKRQRTATPAAPPQTSIDRPPHPQAPATRPSQSSSSVAARANSRAADGKTVIRLVWLPAMPPSVAAQSADASDSAASSDSATARNEPIEALKNREFIAPRSIAKPAPSVSENRASGAASPQEPARESAAQTEPGAGATRRDRAVTPFSPGAASSAAPALPVPQPPASNPNAPTSLQAGAPAAAAPPAAPRLKDSGKSGAFGGSSGGSNDGSNSKRARGSDASERADNRTLGMDTTRPGPANSDLRLSTSKPIAQQPVQRARLRVIAPRDMAQARIEVVLPAGVRVAGSKSNAITAALPYVVWRGSAQRGQSIEVEFVIGTSAAAPTTAPTTAPQLTVQLVEITPSALHQQQPGERSSGVQKTTPRGQTKQRIISRRSVAIPMSQK